MKFDRDRTPQQRGLISRRSLLAAGLSLPLSLAINRALAAPKLAPPPEVAQRLPRARLLGSGRLTFFALHVYDARLWAGSDLRAANYSNESLAIELEYARKLYGKAIAERSIDEMRNQAEIAEPKAKDWLAQMSAIFTDVGPGDRITGIQQPGEAAIFYLNGRLIGEIRDPLFTPLFFGIWLSPKTSEPGLRKALIGEAGGSPP